MTMRRSSSSPQIAQAFVKRAQLRIIDGAGGFLADSGQ